MTTPISHGAGRYRYSVTIEKLAGARGGTGEVLDTWQAFKTVRAGIEPVRGREFFSAGRIDAETTHVVYIRYTAGIDPSMRVNYGGRYLYIQAVVDIDERHREIELTCVERFNQQ